MMEIIVSCSLCFFCDWGGYVFVCYPSKISQTTWNKEEKVVCFFINLCICASGGSSADLWPVEVRWRHPHCSSACLQQVRPAAAGWEEILTFSLLLHCMLLINVCVCVVSGVWWSCGAPWLCWAPTRTRPVPSESCRSALHFNVFMYYISCWGTVKLHLTSVSVSHFRGFCLWWTQPGIHL